MPVPSPFPRFFFLSLIPLCHSLIISAPEACGGTHVVTHAMAFFGPKPDTSDVHDVPIFAPRAQADGIYLRRAAAMVMLRAKSSGKVRVAFPSLRTLFRVLVGLTAPYRKAVSSIGGGSHTSSNVQSEADSVEDRDAQSEHGSVRAAEESEGQGRKQIGLSLSPRNEDSEKSFESEARIAFQSRVDNSAGEDESDPTTDFMPFSLFNACRQLSVPSDLAAMRGRVAVVTRGVCDFAQKVGFMQDAGAVGVIVVNFKDEGEKLANMKLNETKTNSKEIDIPAVMISYKDWASIEPCRNDTKVVFTAEGEATFDIDYGREALNWAMMRGMALWILCQCGVNVVRYKRRVSEFRARADAIAALPVDTYSRLTTHDHEEANVPAEGPPSEVKLTETVPSPNVAGPAPSSPILDHDRKRVAEQGSLLRANTPSASSSVPTPSSSTVIEQEEESDDEEPVCAVCLEEFENGQQVRLLACSHLYHRTCIDPWLQSSSNSCPLCKREVPNLPPLPSQMNYGSMNV